MRPRIVISCLVTATSCELQPSKSSNAPKTWLTGLLQPLSGDFWSNDVTSRHVNSRDVICSNLTTTSCELQDCSSSNLPKTWCTGLLQPLPGDFRSNDVTSGSLWSREVIWRHFLSRDCHLLRYSPVGAQPYSKLDLQAFYSHFLVTSCQVTSLPGPFRSREVTWRHFRARGFNLLRVTALWELKRTQNLNFRPSTATSRWLPVK